MSRLLKCDCCGRPTDSSENLTEWIHLDFSYIWRSVKKEFDICPKCIENERFKLEFSADPYDVLVYLDWNDK